MQNKNEDEGPAWNKFWLSMDHETDSMLSGSHHGAHTNTRSQMSPEMSRHGIMDKSSVLPNESASHNGDGASEFVAEQHPDEQMPFPFKFKAPSGRVHRVNIFPASGVADLVSQVTAKLGHEVEAVGGEPIFEDDVLTAGYALSYLDNEGDTVSITTDQDMRDAVSLAHLTRHNKVDMFVHDPTQPPVPTIIEQPPPPPPASNKTAAALSDDLSATAIDDQQPGDPRRKLPRSRSPGYGSFAEEQFIQGVPNELLLPGAIVTLAAVIAVVFTLSRTGSNR